MVDTHVKVTRSQRIVPRARFYEEVVLDVDVENKMASLTCEPTVSSKSNGQADTCVDLMLALLSTLH